MGKTLNYNPLGHCTLVRGIEVRHYGAIGLGSIVKVYIYNWVLVWWYITNSWTMDKGTQLHITVSWSRGKALE